MGMEGPLYCKRPSHAHHQDAPHGKSGENEQVTSTKKDSFSWREVRFSYGKKVGSVV